MRVWGINSDILEAFIMVLVTSGHEVLVGERVLHSGRGHSINMNNSMNVHHSWTKVGQRPARKGWKERASKGFINSEPGLAGVCVRVYVRTYASMGVYACMYVSSICVCVYVCMCVCMYVSGMYTCMYMYMYVCIHVWVYVCMYVCRICMCVYHVCIYVCMYRWCMRVFITYMCSCVCIYNYVYIYISIWSM